MAGEISTFVDGAYSVTEELSVNPSILSMDTEIQTPILADCVDRNFPRPTWNKSKVYEKTQAAY